MPNLETLRGTDPDGLDPFGLLNDRERTALRELLEVDSSLPLPGTVLPLSWEPTPPVPPAPPAPPPVSTPRPSYRCLACAIHGRTRSASYIVGRNAGPEVRPYLPVGSMVCWDCYNRRVRYHRRYTFYSLYTTCSQGGASTNDHTVGFVQSASDDGRYARGQCLCENCFNRARRNGHQVQRLR